MSAKGLEWALRLRADLQIRIDHLREALTAIEPLRRELTRLEEQLKGVDRLVAVYYDQLGYRDPQDARAVFTRAEEADAATPEGALLPVEVPPPTLVAMMRGEVIRVVAMCHRRTAIARDLAARFWLSLRRWLAKRLAQPDART